MQRRDYALNSKTISKAAEERTESQNRMSYMQVKDHRKFYEFHPLS